MHSTPLDVGELSTSGSPPTDICLAVQGFQCVLTNPFPISEKIPNFYSLCTLKASFLSDLLMLNLHRNTQQYPCLLEPLLSRLHPVHT